MFLSYFLAYCSMHLCEKVPDIFIHFNLKQLNYKSIKILLIFVLSVILSFLLSLELDDTY